MKKKYLENQISGCKQLDNSCVKNLQSIKIMPILSFFFIDDGVQG